ncbi:GntR family transcriptional regulator [Bacillus paramycoides]|uniref:GntR family transcriptional regulator n=1 Tax=Bacillus paramycoides TaxID=2026194 RepID=UPI002E1E67E6|nr:GntR family transcriptional regulator [Bacillus paramycoides]MED0973510.1 GntR family transcriptional regulator [Bacillus paramycoides]
MKIDFISNVPIYIQIRECIKKEIGTGYLKPGDKIPSVRELELELQVNSNTIQHAFKELEREGIVVIRKGRGRYVTNNDVEIMKLRKSMEKELICFFINGMESLGFTKKEMIVITLSFLKTKDK